MSTKDASRQMAASRDWKKVLIFPLVLCIWLTIVVRPQRVGNDGTIVFEQEEAGNPLGPGKGAWVRGLPTDVGLEPLKTRQAAVDISTALGHRSCTIIVKNGRVIEERYDGDWHRDSMVIIDSIGKSVAALVVGRAVTMGLLDLDKPIHQYGVKTDDKLWSNPKLFESVTTRHLLSQTTGRGKAMPGSNFTYDSDEYIQHLSSVISAVGKKPAADWARQNLLETLGLPRFYSYEDLGGDFSVGGGQMATCRDVARFAQLVLNKGKWLDGDSQDVQLISEDYISQMLSPSEPKVSHSYGFLTWLNTVPEPHGPQCCSLSFCATVHHRPPNRTATPSALLEASGYGAAASANGYGTPGLADSAAARNGANVWLASDTQAQVLRGQLVAGAPENMAIMAGSYSKFAMLLPSDNMAVVSLGFTWPQGQRCLADISAEDEGLAATVMYKAVAPVVAHENSMQGWENDVESNKGAPQPKGLLVHPADPNGKQAQAMGLAGAFRSNGDVPKYQVMDPEAGTVNTYETGTVSGYETTISHAEDMVDPEDAWSSSLLQARSAAEVTLKGEVSTIIGSVRCTCPPVEGFGRCFDLRKADVPDGVLSAVNTPGVEAEYLAKGGEFCPSLGVLMSCEDEATSTQGSQCNDPPQATQQGVDGAMELALTPLKCMLAQSCSDQFRLQQCSCKPTSFQNCQAFKAACPHTPFYPKVHVLSPAEVIKCNSTTKPSDGWCY